MLRLRCSIHFAGSCHACPVEGKHVVGWQASMLARGGQAWHVSISANEHHTTGKDARAPASLLHSFHRLVPSFPR